MKTPATLHGDTVRGQALFTAKFCVYISFTDRVNWSGSSTFPLR